MDYKNLFASDGTGEAVRAQVDTNRTAGATVLSVDNLDNWPAQFIFMTGTVLPSGYIDPATATVMKGHTSGGDIIIDSFAPGYPDLGNTSGQIAVIKPNTLWVDELTNLARVSHNDDGTLKNDVITTPDQFTDPVDPALRYRENFFDHIASGGVLTGSGYGSTLGWALTAGVVYINGKRYTFPAASGVVVASKDTYFDLLEPVSGQVATLVLTGGNSVANNAASPALAANSVRIGIIVSGASSIANVGAVNQGQYDKVLPIASSIAYTTTDSLGNLICPRDPSRKVLGYRQSTTPSSTASTSAVLAIGLTVPVIVPTGRRVKITCNSFSLYVPTGGAIAVATIYRTSVAGSVVAEAQLNNNSAGNVGAPCQIQGFDSPSSASNTYVVGITTSNAARTITLDASANRASSIMVELV